MCGNDAPLWINDLSAGYFGKRVLESISLTISEPGIYVVLGLNGAGKTTLFRAIAGVLSPLSGSVKIKGFDSVSREARSLVAYLSHYDGIPEGMTVGEALEFYARIEGADERKVQQAMSDAGISELASKKPGQLSQGQKKRVAVARVFLSEKLIYLLDEPTANLDPVYASELRQKLLQLGRGGKKVILYSSHNLYEARDVGDNVVLINQGRLVTFSKISDLKPSRYLVGVRPLAETEEEKRQIAEFFKGYRQDRDYFIVELSGPSEVPQLLAKLASSGIKVREVVEMGNPLEELLKELRQRAPKRDLFPALSDTGLISSRPRATVRVYAADAKREKGERTRRGQRSKNTTSCSRGPCAGKGERGGPAPSRRLPNFGS